MSEYTLQHNCYIFGREASIHSTKNTLANSLCSGIYSPKTNTLNLLFESSTS